MRIRSRLDSTAKVDVQLTSMIDVVFQLLAFFLVTFRVAAAEGDFSLKMPLRNTDLDRAPADDIEIRLAADAAGDLRQVTASGIEPFGGGEATAGFRRLSAHVTRRLAAARNAGQDEPHVRIAADDGLRYEYVVDAIGAAAIFVGDDGRTTTSARKVTIVGRPADR